MTEHTPGPWKISYGYAQRGKYAGHMAVHPLQGPPLSYLPKGREDIQEANARLIASAPDLLRRLEIIAKKIDRANGSPHFTAGQYLIIKDLIAKAKGQ